MICSFCHKMVENVTILNGYSVCNECKGKYATIWVGIFIVSAIIAFLGLRRK